MLGVKAGDEASFELLLAKYRTPLIHCLPTQRASGM